MKILVTGSTGFIGSYLCAYFAAKGMQVIKGKRNVLAGDNIFFDLDVLNIDSLQNKQVDADVLIHTATANDIISKNTLNGLELSGIGTKNILEFALKNSIKKVIVFSTLQVYGSELNGEYNENHPLNFQNDYAVNHILAEMYAEKYSRENNIQCVSVRPSNVYGKILQKSFNRWSLVPGCFCKEAFESNTITIKSSGLQMRDFVSLHEVACSIEKIIENFPDQYECFNIASGKTVSMLQIAEIVQNVFSKKFNKLIKINVEGKFPEKSNIFKISINKLKNLGFIPNENITLETEIEQIINYLKN